MINPLFFVIGGIIARQIYKRYATPQQKRKVEEFMQKHPTEVGLVMMGAGVFTRSPRLVISGVWSVWHNKNKTKTKKVRGQLVKNYK